MIGLNEKAFEAQIRSLIIDNILTERSDLMIMDSKKAVDILICKNGAEPALFFLEVKFHKLSHGRLGFGSSGGIGFQPEILKKQPEYFARNMRWIIGHEKHGLGRFILLNNRDLANYVAGGVVGTKFNNIQARIFDQATWLSETELIRELQAWIS